MLNYFINTASTNELFYQLSVKKRKFYLSRIIYLSIFVLETKAKISIYLCTVSDRD